MIGGPRGRAVGSQVGTKDPASAATHLGVWYSRNPGRRWLRKRMGVCGPLCARRTYPAPRST